MKANILRAIVTRSKVMRVNVIDRQDGRYDTQH
jgi:hypothetical protein